MSVSILDSKPSGKIVGIFGGWNIVNNFYLDKLHMVIIYDILL